MSVKGDQPRSQSEKTSRSLALGRGRRSVEVGGLTEVDGEGSEPFEKKMVGDLRVDSGVVADEQGWFVPPKRGTVQLTCLPMYEDEGQVVVTS